MKHRGPDSSDHYADDFISLFHHRLAIQGLSSLGTQPMSCENKRYWLVFNGEIYNFRELQAQYKLQNQSGTDSEILLRLLALKGANCLNELRGIFAFAFYDSKRSSLLLARDPFGVKPLHYKYSSNEFAFASEARALLSPANEFNERAIYEYLNSGLLLHQKMTFFKDIYNFPPGHYLEWNQQSNSLEFKTFFTLNILNWNELSTDFHGALEDCQSLLNQSICRNLVSDAKVAISLSSGVDSLLIASLLEKQNQALKAFTFGFEEPDYDEVRRLHPKILERLEVIPTYVNKLEFLPLMQEACYFFESPLGGLGTLSAYKLNSQVRKNGIKVLLTGEGSDEIFAGYKYYYKSLFADYFSKNEPENLSNAIAKYNEIMGEAITWDQGNQSQYLNHLESTKIMAPDGSNLCSSYLGKRIAELQFLPQKFEFDTPDSFLNHRMILDLYSLKLPKLLHFQDRASMAFGVENRVPFLDQDLVQFAYGLHPSLKIHQGRAKALIVELLESRFKLEIAKRPKHFVATPQREWLRDPKIFSQIIETIRFGRSVSDQWIDFNKFFTQYDHYLNQSELGNSFFIWKAISLEHFLQTNFTEVKSSY